MPVGIHVCSNAKCGAVWSRDPQGHCPLCKQDDGSGWSTMWRELDPPVPMKIEISQDAREALAELAEGVGKYDGSVRVGKRFQKDSAT